MAKSFLAQDFSELSGRDACIFVKLPAEMFYIIVTALSRNLGEALFCVGEKVFRFAESKIDDIIYTGNWIERYKI